ncbi:hypothetical protein [Limibacillus sp. MBR-115]|jgi:regulator of RNase E activity RraA|uniref:RraA family protein n=1 Tax=Limibacillus sp. MBR-115 TaxID=3156465 RepID=UPI003392A975
MSLEDIDRLNASLIADAMQRVGGVSFVRGQQLSGFQPQSGKPAVGLAYTVRVRFAQEKTGEERARWFDAIDTAPGGAIFVIQADEDVGAAVFGEMVALRLNRRGLAGVVVDGDARDVLQLREIGLPFWTRGATPTGMIPNDADTSVAVTLEIDGVEVAPGDLVAADADGVMVCPAERIEEVLSVARAFRDSEAVTVENLKAGHALIDVYPSKTSIEVEKSAK